MSGELAYALSDLFFKGRGLLRGDISGDRSIIDNPSFFSISMGIGFGSKNIDFDLKNFDFEGYDDGDDDFNLKFGASTAVAAEGAYFFNKYIGVGGRLRVNSSPIKGWDNIENLAYSDIISMINNGYEDEDLTQFMEGVGIEGEPGYSPPLVQEGYFTIKSDHLTEFSADLGVYFNLPLSTRLALGSKLLVGRSIMQEIDLNATITGGKRKLNIYADNPYDDMVFLSDTYTSEWDYFTVGGNNTTKVGTGLSLTYAYKNNFAWKVFFDYDYTRKTYTMTYNPIQFLFDAIGMSSYDDFSDDIFVEEQSIKKDRHTFILGGSFTISF